MKFLENSPLDLKTDQKSGSLKNQDHSFGAMMGMGISMGFLRANRQSFRILLISLQTNAEL